MAGKVDKTSIGRLRYKCDLKSPTDTSDGAGGRSQTYSTIAQIYADIRLLVAMKHTDKARYRQRSLTRFTCATEQI